MEDNLLTSRLQIFVGHGCQRGTPTCPQHSAVTTDTILSSGPLSRVGATSGRISTRSWPISSRDTEPTRSVSMAGTSWLATTQWFVGATRPPHLTCLAPWGGWSDLYADVAMRGGIPSPGYSHDLLCSWTQGLGRVEDVAAMARDHPMMDEYWEDRKAQLDRIDVPLYVATSWTSSLHTSGSFRGFHESVSKHKWLRVHNSHEWPGACCPSISQNLPSPC